MKIQGFRRILTEDLPQENRPIGDKLAFAINPFAEEIITAINGRLNIADNLNQKYKEITLSLNSDGTPKIDTSFQHGLITRCKGISVEFAENQTNVNIYPSAAPFVTFTENNNIVTIKHITGLQADNKWKLRLLCKGD